MNNIREILEQSNGRVFTVEFIKKDGSLRKMNCRLGVKKNLAGGDLRYDPNDFGYLSVFDMGKKEYRMINLNTIQSIKSGGKEYLVVRS